MIAALSHFLSSLCSQLPLVLVSSGCQNWHSQKVRKYHSHNIHDPYIRRAHSIMVVNQQLS